MSTILIRNLIEKKKKKKTKSLCFEFVFDFLTFFYTNLLLSFQILQVQGGRNKNILTYMFTLNLRTHATEEDVPLSVTQGCRHRLYFSKKGVKAQRSSIYCQQQYQKNNEEKSGTPLT